MEDTRVRVPLNGKQINLSQLDRDLGGHGLCDDPDNDAVIAVEGSPITEADLAAAVAAHVPCHQPLDETGRILTLLALYEGSALPSANEIVKMRDGLTIETVQAEFYAWLEAAGL